MESQNYFLLLLVKYTVPRLQLWAERIICFTTTFYPLDQISTLGSTDDSFQWNHHSRSWWQYSLAFTLDGPDLAALSKSPHLIRRLWFCVAFFPRKDGIKPVNDIKRSTKKAPVQHTKLSLSLSLVVFTDLSSTPLILFFNIFSLSSSLKSLSEVLSSVFFLWNLQELFLRTGFCLTQNLHSKSLVLED